MPRPSTQGKCGRCPMKDRVFGADLSDNAFYACWWIPRTVVTP